MIDRDKIKQGADLLAWVRKDTALEEKIKGEKGAHNGEWCGPCPFCGGDDRFLVWPKDNPPGWWCRQCQRGGDAIAYVMQRHNVGFRQACDWLAGGPLPQTATRRGDGRHRNAMPKPDPGPPPANWQETGRRIVADCETALWSDAGADARAWLLGERGLTEDTLRAWRVGYHHAGGQKGRELRGAWVWRGIVIPWFADGHLWKIQIRRPTANPKERYAQVKGSAGYGPGLYGADKWRGKADCLVTEGELDALLVWQEVGDLVDVLTLGNASEQVADRWLPLLLSIKRFWIATDNDEAGHKAAIGWLELTGKRGQRILPPGGAKDAGDAWKDGADLRAWVLAALDDEPKRINANLDARLDAVAATHGGQAQRLGEPEAAPGLVLEHQSARSDTPGAVLTRQTTPNHTSEVEESGKKRTDWDAGPPPWVGQRVRIEDLAEFKARWGLRTVGGDWPQGEPCPRLELVEG